MDYEEFLWALGDHTTFPLLQKVLDTKCNIGEQINRELLRKFKIYMLVGGMPQAVKEYIRTNNFKMVDDVKRDILNLYAADLNKIDETGRLSIMLEAIPSQLNKNSNGYKIKSVIDNYYITMDAIFSLLADFKDSKIINIAYHANDRNVGLSGYKDLNKFKLYLLDTGLFVTLMFRDRDFTENDLYKKLLSNKLSVNLGYLFENVVAQMLTAKGNELFYYTFNDVVNHRNFEIDFLLTRNNKICPIEVKSGDYLKHKSLDEFYNKYSDHIYKRIILHTKDVKKDADIYCLPVYMTPLL